MCITESIFVNFINLCWKISRNYAIEIVTLSFHPITIMQNMFIDHNMLTKIIFISVLMILVVIMMFIIKKSRHSKRQALEKIAIQKLSLPSLVDEFSGDNRCDTELDLAKAYIELRQNEKAKYLLKSVVSNGNPDQIAEARRMFMVLLKQDREMKTEDIV